MIVNETEVIATLDLALSELSDLQRILVDYLMQDHSTGLLSKDGIIRLYGLTPTYNLRDGTLVDEFADRMAESLEKLRASLERYGIKSFQDAWSLLKGGHYPSVASALKTSQQRSFGPVIENHNNAGAQQLAPTARISFRQPQPAPQTKWGELEKADMCRMRSLGAGYREIMEQHRVSFPVLCKILELSGITLVHSKKWSDQDRLDMCDMHAAGVARSVIMIRYKILRGSLNRILRNEHVLRGKSKTSNKQWSEEDELEMCRMHAAGKRQEIRLRYGMSEAGVDKILARRKALLSSPRRTEQEKAGMYNMRAAGASRKEIMAHYGISGRGLTDILLAQRAFRGEVAPKILHKWTDQQKQEMFQMNAAGVARKEIMVRFKISRSRLSKLLSVHRNTLANPSPL